MPGKRFPVNDDIISFVDVNCECMLYEVLFPSSQIPASLPPT